MEHKITETPVPEGRSHTHHAECTCGVTWELADETPEEKRKAMYQSHLDYYTKQGGDAT